MGNITNKHKYYYIYAIKNIINGKKYVGVHATNKEFDIDDYDGSGLLLKNAIRKYGRDNFIFGILEYIKFDEWQEKEKFWIKELESHTSMWGYNQTWGGDGTLGLIWNDNQRKLLKKRMEDPQERFKLGAGNRGRKQSQEEIEMRRKKLKGLKRSPGSIERYRLSRIGDKNPMFGISPSVETKNKLRDTALNQKKIKCEHCGKEMFLRHYKQWHGDKCKMKGKIVKESL